MRKIRPLISFLFTKLKSKEMVDAEKIPRGKINALWWLTKIAKQAKTCYERIFLLNCKSVVSFLIIKESRICSLFQFNVCFLFFSSQNSFERRKFNRVNKSLFNTSILLEQSEVPHHPSSIKSKCFWFYSQSRIWKTWRTRRKAVCGPGNILKGQQTPMMASCFEHLMCVNQELRNINRNNRKDAWSPTFFNRRCFQMNDTGAILRINDSRRKRKGEWVFLINKTGLRFFKLGFLGQNGGRRVISHF